MCYKWSITLCMWVKDQDLNITKGVIKKKENLDRGSEILGLVQILP